MIVIINEIYRCSMSGFLETANSMPFLLANDNSHHIDNDSRIQKLKNNSNSFNANSKSNAPSILEIFIEKNGYLPNPSQASTIGRLIGTRVKASDGKLYPKLTKFEKICVKTSRDERKRYHRRTENIMKLNLALECFSSETDPAELAVHIKNAADVGERLDSALDWLVRFAKELGNRDKACCP